MSQCHIWYNTNYQHTEKFKALQYHWLDIYYGCILNSILLYLEHSEGEGVSQVVMGGEQHFAVVSIQIHTGEQVQLGVHPVETPVRQV